MLKLMTNRSGEWVVVLADWPVDATGLQKTLITGAKRGRVLRKPGSFCRAHQRPECESVTWTLRC